MTGNRYRHFGLIKVIALHLWVLGFGFLENWVCTQQASPDGNEQARRDKKDKAGQAKVGK